ncbi:MAG: uroporphyrinogen-III synthase [Vicinamibacterales bacterium]
MSSPSFQNLRVLALESRRQVEIASIITAYGGRPLSAPAMREVPLDSNTEAFAFVAALVRGEFDVFVSLTGVGLRAVLDIAAQSVGRDAFVAALTRVRVVARGPKPLAVLREIGIVPWVLAPEPNTWRDLLAAVDVMGSASLEGARLAVQEYGTTSPSLLEGLRVRGAIVTRVPVYRYALPEDLVPLQAAAGAVSRGEVDVVLFTTATQVTHLLQVGDDLKIGAELRRELPRLVVGSIGPTTSEELREQGVEVDIEASHPKMGVLVRDAAERSPALLLAKREARNADIR